MLSSMLLQPVNYIIAQVIRTSLCGGFGVECLCQINLGISCEVQHLLHIGGAVRDGDEHDDGGDDGNEHADDRGGDHGDDPDDGHEDGRGDNRAGSHDDGRGADHDDDHDGDRVDDHHGDGSIGDARVRFVSLSKLMNWLTSKWTRSASGVRPSDSQ